MGVIHCRGHGGFRCAALDFDVSPLQGNTRNLSCTHIPLRLAIYFTKKNNTYASGRGVLHSPI